MALRIGSRIAVIGAGISGIAAANVLKKNGFEPVVFEKGGKVGGVWAVAYPIFSYKIRSPHIIYLIIPGRSNRTYILPAHRSSTTSSKLSNI